MGIKEFFNGYFKKDFKKGNSLEISNNGTKVIYENFIGIKKNKIFLEYALSTCINKIANAITQCTFDTYLKGEEKKGDMWYAFNISPNQNQNITDFWNKVILKMITDENGALIIQSYEGEFLIADSYDISEKAFLGNKYTNVTIGDLTLNRDFDEKEVLRLKYTNKNVKSLLEDLYKVYGEILSMTIKNYKRDNSKKAIIKIESLFGQYHQIEDEDGKTEGDYILDSILKDRLKAHFSDEDSATPIEEGLNLIEKENKGDKKGTSDIRSVFDDILNMCADAFNIPRGLLKGDIADVEAMTDNFITFCINPIASQIEDEVNRKLYTKNDIIKNTKLRVKTNTIMNYNVTKLASSAEALYRIRSVNTNWVRKLLREEIINEDWANEYMETKNYQTVNQHLKGGENNGKEKD